MWICVSSCKQFEETFENTQWRKVQPMQPIWLCILSGKWFEETLENTQGAQLCQAGSYAASNGSLPPTKEYSLIPLLLLPRRYTECFREHGYTRTSFKQTQVFMHKRPQIGRQKPFLYIARSLLICNTKRVQNDEEFVQLILFIHWQIWLQYVNALVSIVWGLHLTVLWALSS